MGGPALRVRRHHSTRRSSARRSRGRSSTSIETLPARSLYPGQATTELCPTTTFDGEPLYRDGQVPDAAEIERRKARWFVPYHEALSAELERLRGVHEQVVLYDGHSIRSSIPRLFEGILPHFNIGTNGGASCAPELTAAVEAACDATSFSRVTNGRFRGGFITRHHGQPQAGVHAIQMELACRSYLPNRSAASTRRTGRPPFDDALRRTHDGRAGEVLQACVALRGRDNPRSTSDDPHRQDTHHPCATRSRREVRRAGRPRRRCGC